MDGLTGAALAIASGDYAEAVRQAQAEWARRQFADVADTLGWTLHLAGRDAEALSYVEHANATGARSAAYAYHLGAVEAALGRSDAAAKDLRRALVYNPLAVPAARQLLNEVTR